MGRFRFTLERVLQVRVSQERAAATALAQANQELANLRNRLEASLEGSRRVVEQVSEGVMDSSLAWSLKSGLQLEITRVHRAMEAQQTKVSECTTTWQQARRQLELLEKLREARFKEYQRSEQLNQERSLDEWVIQSH